MRGQSLIELLVAIGIFVITVSALAFFVLDSYVAGRLAQETTKANFLAEEGLEAARSIRDNNWGNLVGGPLGSPVNYGLTISGAGNWDFFGTQEDISGQLRQGIRIISIENIDDDRKKITSRIAWQFAEGRSQEIQLVTYLTNWAKINPYLAQLHYRWRNDDGGE